MGMMFRPPVSSILSGNGTTVLQGLMNPSLGFHYDADASRYSGMPYYVVISTPRPDAELPLPQASPLSEPPKMPVTVDRCTVISNPEWWPTGDSVTREVPDPKGGIVHIGDATWRFRSLIDHVHELSPKAARGLSLHKASIGVTFGLSIISFGALLFGSVLASLPFVGLTALAGVGIYLTRDDALSVKDLEGDPSHLYAFAKDSESSEIVSHEDVEDECCVLHDQSIRHTLSNVVDKIFSGDGVVELSEKSAPIAIALWYHDLLQKFTRGYVDGFAKTLHMGKNVKIGESELQDLVSLMDVMPMIELYQQSHGMYFDVMNVLRLHRSLPVFFRGCQLHGDHTRITDVAEAKPFS